MQVPVINFAALGQDDAVRKRVRPLESQRPGVPAYVVNERGVMADARQRTSVGDGKGEEGEAYHWH